MTTEDTEGTEPKITIKASSWTKMVRERDEAREALENHMAATIHTCHDECKRPMCVLRRERDEALELVSELKRKISDYCDEQLRLVFENRRLHQERDEARREVDRYREEKDLSPMSWDT